MTGTKYSGGMLAKGLGLLAALGNHPDGVGVSNLAREAGMPVSTAHRLLSTLVDHGFARFDPASHRYMLGLKVFELSHRVSLVKGLSEVALPIMKRVARQTGELTLMTVRDDLEMVYVERVQGDSRIQIRGNVGDRGPLYCTAMGKTLLAFLPRVEQDAIISRLRMSPMTPRTITDPKALREELDLTKERGYGIANEEYEVGIRAVAVPVIGPRGTPVAMHKAATALLRVSLRDLEAHIPLLKESAREIAIQLPRGEAVFAAGQRREAV
jgi:DNA-binding IclR family transcriptional regulator